MLLCTSKLFCIKLDPPVEGELTDSGHYRPNLMSANMGQSFDHVDDSVHVGMRNHHTRKSLAHLSSKTIPSPVKCYRKANKGEKKVTPIVATEEE